MSNEEKHYIIDGSNKYQLPVPPSEWQITSSQNVTTTNVLGFGEVINGSLPVLKAWSISGIFPYKNYHFISSARMLDQWEYIDLFQQFKDEAKELIYTISDTSVYIPCIITNLVYGENDSSGDINYTLDFKENKSFELVDKDGRLDVKGYVPENSIYGYYWTVKDGDSLLSICKKAYGDSSKFKELLSKNNLKNPSQVKTGMVLKL